MADGAQNYVEKEAQDAAAAAAISTGVGDQGRAAAVTSTASSGAVQAFRDIRRELTTEELSNAGVQKLILNTLDSTLARCEALASFETRFHERDKEVAILEEKLSKRLALDIAWTTGVAVGLALVTTVASVPPESMPSWLRIPLIALGTIFIVGGIAVRVVLR